MKLTIFSLTVMLLSLWAKAQSNNCTFDKPLITIHFGTGNIQDINETGDLRYRRVGDYCPRDGNYSYTPITARCFRDDWHTIAEDHTPGDAQGNMLIVNSSYDTGEFFRTTINGLHAGKIYEFGVWMMNVCRITDKCPYPLLPNITMTLQTQAGKPLLNYSTGDVVRVRSVQWTQYKAIFTAPASETSLTLIMTNHRPGGCGNDFAMDDITFRECIPPTPVVTKTAKPKTVPKQPTTSTKPPTTKPQAKKTTPKPNNKTVTVTDSKNPPVAEVNAPAVKSKPLSPAPSILRTRENSLVKKIETEEGQINVKLYDNGQIDEDTVSIYHNNVLVVSHARLSEKPINLNINIDRNSPHHELVMVAENLGSIPPNTSLMVVTAGGKRYEVFISSSEQKNAKVVFDLKE